MTAAPYDWKAVVARLLFSMLLVFSLYNPSGYSYWHWMGAPTNGPWNSFWAKGFVGLGVLGLHVLVWKTVFAILRPSGVFYILTLSGLGFAAMSEFGLLDRQDGGTVLIAVMLTMVAVLTAGLTLASIMHRLTGVQHVEEVPH
ncbi:DUF6524 family protein [Rhodovarius sp.]|jgi:hypothetical protein|uniref:DUF6524 family protein n=1 Tax=Rhodovarius sp. TaxID=2972673 RepID=UPI0033416CF7